jgi:hypothetical protein
MWGLSERAIIPYHPTSRATSSNISPAVINPLPPLPASATETLSGFPPLFIMRAIVLSYSIPLSCTRGGTIEGGSEALPRPSAGPDENLSGQA